MPPSRRKATAAAVRDQPCDTPLELTRRGLQNLVSTNSILENSVEEREIQRLEERGEKELGMVRNAVIELQSRAISRPHPASRRPVRPLEPEERECVRHLHWELAEVIDAATDANETYDDNSHAEERRARVKRMLSLLDDLSIEGGYNVSQQIEWLPTKYARSQEQREGRCKGMVDTDEPFDTPASNDYSSSSDEAKRPRFPSPPEIPNLSKIGSGFSGNKPRANGAEAEAKEAWMRKVEQRKLRLKQRRAAAMAAAREASAEEDVWEEDERSTTLDEERVIDSTPLGDNGELP